MKITKKTMGILVGGVAVTLMLTFGLGTGYAVTPATDTYFSGPPSVSIQANEDGSVNATIDATYVDNDAVTEGFPVSQCFSTATVPGGHNEKADDASKTGGILGFQVWKPGDFLSSTLLAGCPYPVDTNRVFAVLVQSFTAVNSHRAIFSNFLPIGLSGGPAFVYMSVDKQSSSPPTACGTFKLHAELSDIDPAGVTASPDPTVILDVLYGNESPGTSGVCIPVRAHFSER